MPFSPPRAMKHLILGSSIVKLCFRGSRGTHRLLFGGIVQADPRNIFCCFPHPFYVTAIKRTATWYLAWTHARLVTLALGNGNSRVTSDAVQGKSRRGLGVVTIFASDLGMWKPKWRLSIVPVFIDFALSSRPAKHGETRLAA